MRSSAVHHAELRYPRLLGKWCVTLVALTLAGFGSQAAAQSASDASSLGSLKLAIDGPKDCFIFVNKRRLVKQDGAAYTAEARLPPFPQGRYQITLSKEGFKDASVSCRVAKDGQPIKVRMSPGQSELLGQPYWGDVKIDEILPPAEPHPAAQKHAKLFGLIAEQMAKDRVRLTVDSPDSGKQPDFADVPFEGAVLVGLRYRQGEWAGGIEVLKAVRPVFLSRRGQFVGKNHGIQDGRETEVLAKEGYAVGAFITKPGTICDAVQLVFMRMTPKGLNPRDYYTTTWLGGDGRSGGKVQVLSGNGRPIVGIAGRAPGALATIRLAVVQ